MSTRFVEAVADDNAFTALCATTPSKAGIAYQVDSAALVIKSPAGTKSVIPVAAAALVVAGVAASYKIARGVHQQAAASDTIATGLATVVAVIVSFRDTPTAKQNYVTGSIGDQSAAPVAGSFLSKTFKSTFAAADDFTDNLSFNWIAIGT